MTNLSVILYWKTPYPFQVYKQLLTTSSPRITILQTGTQGPLNTHWYLSRTLFHVLTTILPAWGLGIIPYQILLMSGLDKWWFVGNFGGNLICEITE